MDKNGTLQKLKVADVLKTTLKPIKIVIDEEKGTVILHYEKYNNNLSISLLSDNVVIKNKGLYTEEEIQYNSVDWVDYLHEVLNDFIFDEY